MDPVVWLALAWLVARSRRPAGGPVGMTLVTILPDPARVAQAATSAGLAGLRFETYQLYRRWSVEAARLADGWGPHWDVLVTSTTRTQADQAALYAQGRTAPGPIVTHIDGITRQSMHQQGRAWDFVPRLRRVAQWGDRDRFKSLGRAGTDIGLIWGGDWSEFPDLPHLEDRS